MIFELQTTIHVRDKSKLPATIALCGLSGQGAGSLALFVSPEGVVQFNAESHERVCKKCVEKLNGKFHD